MSPPCSAWKASACLRTKLLLDRLVGAGRQERGLGEQLDLQRQQVAEDARQRDHHVDARPAQARRAAASRAPGEAAVAVEARLGADQRQRLRDRAAFALQVVGAPQHDRDGLGQGAAVVAVPREQALGLARAVAHREGAGDAERVEAVQVAAGRQDVGVRSRSPPGAGRMKPPSSACSRCRRSRGPRPAVAVERARAPRASVTPRGVQHRTRAARASRRLADDVQAVRDQRVFEFEQGRRAGAAIAAASSRRSRPVRPAARSRLAACAWIKRRQRVALRRIGVGRQPRQRSSDALRSSERRDRARPARPAASGS